MHTLFMIVFCVRSCLGIRKNRGFFRCGMKIGFLGNAVAFIGLVAMLGGIMQAKVQNFVILGDGYANDGRQVFHNGVPLDADSKAFALLGYSYASDRIRIFGEGKQLDTTPQSFMLLSDGYARDDKHIFWGNRLVDADFDSFRVMEDGDAEDNYRYFFHGTMIKKKVQR